MCKKMLQKKPEAKKKRFQNYNSERKNDRSWILTQYPRIAKPHALTIYQNVKLNPKHI